MARACTRPSPRGWKGQCLAWDVSGARSASSGKRRRNSTAAGYAGGMTPNPTYQEVCTGLTGHTEVVLVVYDPRKNSYGQLLKLFYKSHDPTQGMRRATMSARNTVPASTRLDAQQKKAAKSLQGRLRQARCDAAGHPGTITTEIVAAPAFLLRRGISPAISGEKSGRLLRHWRHGYRLPGPTGVKA